jgi:SNF2 family DNA or RNA helicase
MKYRPKRPLRSYQAKALKRALEIDYGTAIWFDPGLGKTKVAIDFIAIQRLKHGLSRVLVIAPLSALGVWVDELKLDMIDELKYTVYIPNGRRANKIQVLEEALRPGSDLRFIVCTYEFATDEYFNKQLIKFRPQLLILDEMHNCKGHNTKRSPRIYRIRKVTKWALGLTGTPMPKDPLDLFGQFKILDDSILGTNYAIFRDQYAIMHPKFPNKVMKWKNLDNLAQRIHPIVCRVRDSEVKDLPPLIEQIVPVEFTDKSKKLYREMAENQLIELDNMEVVTAATAMVRVGKLQQICGGFIMKGGFFLDENGVAKEKKVTFPIGTEKLDVFMDLVRQHVKHHKILVGCRFLWEIGQIELRLRKAGIPHVIVKGGMSEAKRTAARHEFQENDNCRIIIFQVAAATAMTLTAADIGILYSTTTKWDHYWQWLKRIHRRTQTKPVVIYTLAVRGTVDYDVLDIVKAKAKMEGDIIDRSKYREWLTPKF